MKEAEDQLPGVTFHHKGSKIFQPEGATTTKKAILTLEASIKDEDLWKEVEKKFVEGLRVYTADDFKGELVNAYRHDNARLKAEAERLAHENARLQRENEYVQKKNEEYQKILSGFSTQLGGGDG